MKNLLYIAIGVALLSFTTSCTAIDNWDGPDSGVTGTVYDVYTQKPILASQSELNIRIWERSYTGFEDGASTYQTLNVKQDGTYNNSKLFSGTYDFYPYDGCFWSSPEDTIKGVVLQKGKKTVQDITVTPYLQIIDFKTELVGEDLTIKYRVRAPLLSRNDVNIGNLYWVRFFISFTMYCGNGNNSNIGFGEWHNPEYNGRKELNRRWTDVINDEGGNGVDTSPEYTLGPITLKRGYLYRVRGGANTNTGSSRPYNYSEIVEIDLR